MNKINVQTYVVTDVKKERRADVLMSKSSEYNIKCTHVIDKIVM